MGKNQEFYLYFFYLSVSRVYKLWQGRSVMDLGFDQTNSVRASTQ